MADKILMKHDGFYWEIDKTYVPSCAVTEGLLCGSKKCLCQMSESIYSGRNGHLFTCEFCGYRVDSPHNAERLWERARKKYIAEERHKLKAVNLDKLPSINERIEEKNKFYNVSVEHSPEGALQDVHILIGRRDNGGKKAHIIVSPDGEIRFDKKDLNPREEIKSITSIIFNEKSIKTKEIEKS